MKTLVGLLLSLLLADLVSAQAPADSVVADTLAWQRYYPLAVGNIWEYQVSEGEPLLTHEIIGDSLVGDRHYYIMDATSYDYLNGNTNLDVLDAQTRYLRYDSIGAVFSVLDIAADTLDAPQDVPLSGYFDLRAAFGDTLYFGAGPEDYYRTWGGYDEQITIGNDTVRVQAFKGFENLIWYESYAADIGFLGGGNLWGPFITYVHIGDMEYGNVRTPTAVEETRVPASFALVSIYPNPTRTVATVAYRISQPAPVTVEVFDVLGRRVWSDKQPVQSIGQYAYRLNLETWPNGTYFVRLSTAGGVPSVRAVTVIR